MRNCGGVVFAANVRCLLNKTTGGDQTLPSLRRSALGAAFSPKNCTSAVGKFLFNLQEELHHSSFRFVHGICCYRVIHSNQNVATVASHKHHSEWHTQWEHIYPASLLIPSGSQLSYKRLPPLTGVRPPHTTYPACTHSSAVNLLGSSMLLINKLLFGSFNKPYSSKCINEIGSISKFLYRGSWGTRSERMRT